MANLNEISAQEIGRRLRIARENAGIRQDSAAQSINVSRPTLVSIEKGDRMVRINELQSLANHYGTSANALLRREAVYTDLIPRFRKLRETEDEHTLEAIQLLNDLVRAEVEFENILGIKRQVSYPTEKGINVGDINQLAEEHAQDLRDSLGLGSGPIADIFTLIELDLGIRLYQRKLSPSSKVAGLFTYDPTVGACILINASHPLGRRVKSAAHELGHFIGTRHSPEVLEDDSTLSSREERYANAFERAFITPKKSFAQSFEQLRAGSDTLTRRLVILLAHQYRISREGCVRRLEELSLVRKGTWEWFEANGGISNKNAEEVLGNSANEFDLAKIDANRPVNHRMALMAYQVWKRDLMSEGQLAELLKISRLELREIVDQIDLEESETDDLLKLFN